VLYFPEDGYVLGQFVKGLSELRAALGKGLPVDVAVLTCELQNGFVVALNVLNFDFRCVDFRHVETISNNNHT
jgi:hypothetical protein